MVKSYPQIQRALADKPYFVYGPKMEEILMFLEFKLAGGIDCARGAQKHSRVQPGGGCQGTESNSSLRLNCSYSHLWSDHAQADGPQRRAAPRGNIDELAIFTASLRQAVGRTGA